jgi:hypothetical protein
MDGDIREQWLKDLRSGNFQQTNGTLAKTQDGRKYEYCCLGVLGMRCGLLEKQDDGELGSGTIYKKAKKGMNGYLAKPKLFDSFSASNTALKFRGRPILSVKAQKKLAEMNDTDGSNFRKIADWIEKNIKPRVPVNDG